MFRKGILLFVLSWFVFSAFAGEVNKIVVFGDSLSDNGNLYEYFKHQIPPSPPYYKGRFTNGFVWAEFLTKSYYPDDWRAHLLDYAFGGAAVSWNNDSYNDELTTKNRNDLLFSLDREVDSYLLSHQDKADQNSLFAVWIGSNNYFSTKFTHQKTVELVNSGIKKNLETLAKKGALYILVINIPNMGKSPIARLIYSEKELSDYSHSHNEALANSIKELRSKYPQVQWILVDADKMFDLVLKNPDEYGFSNVTDTCYRSVVTNAIDDLSAQFILSMSSTLEHANKKEDNPCAGYFFFDPIHPTTYTHKVMASKIKDILREQGVIFG